MSKTTTTTTDSVRLFLHIFSSAERGIYAWIDPVRGMPVTLLETVTTMTLGKKSLQKRMNYFPTCSGPCRSSKTIKDEENQFWKWCYWTVLFRIFSPCPRFAKNTTFRISYSPARVYLNKSGKSIFSGAIRGVGLHQKIFLFHNFPFSYLD